MTKIPFYMENEFRQYNAITVTNMLHLVKVKSLYKKVDIRFCI